MFDVYITKTSKFLPNKVISNDEMESYLGLINNTVSKVKNLILRNNKITSRYYALDKNGKASGILYEDAGDGFQYQKGEYLISGFTAKQKGSNVKVDIKPMEGNLKPTSRKYKVIVVTDNGSVESDWIQKNRIKVKIRVK